jgi:hypothetical protein
VDEHTTARHPVPTLIRALDVAAKSGLVLMLATAVFYPEIGNLEGKAAGLRAIAYPLLSFTVPMIWYVAWRDRASFPWLADLLVTITCFTDILGNRLDLYDSVVWFDDWMHFMNTGLLAAAVILLTLHRSASYAAVLERALAFGATAAIAWELAEFFAFIRFSPERQLGYTDTLGDLTLGVIGCVVAGSVVWGLWRAGRLTTAAPQLEVRAVAVAQHPA